MPPAEWWLPERDGARLDDNAPGNAAAEHTLADGVAVGCARRVRF
jgi:hypothetical protein